MLYIIVEEHSGVLLKIYRCLSAANYKIISNKFGKRTSDKTTYVQLEIGQGNLPLPPALEGELLNIAGCSDILYEKPQDLEPSGGLNSDEEHDKTQLKKDINFFTKEIIENFHNIDNIVMRFSQRYQKSNITTSLYSLGFQVGANVYESEYALGKPLKLELALKRMLANAVKSFGKVSCNRQIISIEQNRFCNMGSPNGHCDFTKGFMKGFLQGSPTTKDVRVDNVTCRGNGQSTCSFEFH